MLVLSWAIDIAPYLDNNVWVGFTGSTGASNYQFQTVKAGTLAQLNDSWTFVAQ